MVTFLWILAWGWGLLGLLLALATFNGSGFFLGMVVLAIAAGPCLLLAWTQRKSTSIWEREFTELAKPAGRLIHTEKRTGIAIDPVGKVLYLGREGFSKAYPFEDVREWDSRHETPAEFVGAANMIAATNALGANVRAARTAAANTGLFLRVRDTNAPEWRISMKRNEDRDRWFEILTQAINEGRVVA